MKCWWGGWGWWWWGRGLTETERQRERRRERRRERGEGRKRNRQRERQRGRERHQTLMLLRKRLSRSQSVACPRRRLARGDTCTSRERRHPRVPLDASGYRVCLNLIEASFSGQRVPCFAPNGDCSVQCLVVDLELLIGKWPQWMWLPPWAWCCQDPDPQIDWNEQMRQRWWEEADTAAQHEGRRRERRRRGSEEERRGKGNRWWKSCAFKTQKNAVASGKSVCYTLKFKKYYVFQF